MVTFDNPLAGPSSDNPQSPQFDPWMSSSGPGIEHNHEQHQSAPLERSISGSPTVTETIEYEQKMKLQLLEHPNILTEMQHVTQKRSRFQQQPSSQSSVSQGPAGTTAPCLFVILPKLISANRPTETTAASTTMAGTTGQHQVTRQQDNGCELISQDEFRLHFLCDYSDHVQQEEHVDHMEETQGHGMGVVVAQGQTQGDVVNMDVKAGGGGGDQERQSARKAASTSPCLHVCEPEGGYSLRDLEDFCQVHKMTLLSLLCTLQQQQEQHLQQRPEREQEQGHDLHKRQEEEEERRMQVDVCREKGRAKTQNQDMSHDNCADMDVTEDSYYIHQGLSASRSSLNLSRTSSPPPHPAVPSTLSTLPTSHPLQWRIDVAIRYLLQYFSMSDLEGILNAPSDTTDMQDYDEGFLPSLQVEDFADSDTNCIVATMTSDGRILGPLNQHNITRTRTTANNITTDNTHSQPKPTKPSSTAGAANTSEAASETAGTVGLVQWLCTNHFQLHCMAEAREKMKAVIYKNDGHCVEHERSAELYFRTRENAQEFYALTRQYRCVVKLKIHLGWKDLVESDLWELAEVITVGNVGNLTLDCCYEREEYAEDEEDMKLGLAERMEKEHERQLHQEESKSSLSFKPLLGMLYSPSLVSFTLKNFSGSMPTLSASSFRPSMNGSFTLQAFREANEIALPTTNNLRILVFARCGPEARAHHLLELYRHSPQLIEIEVECELIDEALPMVGEATREFDKVTYLRLTESIWENADLYFGKTRNSNPSGHIYGSIIHAINRKTMRLPSLNLRSCGVAENLTTCSYLQIWDKNQAPFAKLLANSPRLMSMELMCETSTLDRVWRFLMAHYQYHQHILHEKKRASPGLEPQQSTLTFPPIPPEELAVLDASCISHLTAEAPFKKATFFLRLRLNDHACSLMTVTPTVNALVFHSYTPQHRFLLHSVEDITRVFCISSSFGSAEKLSLLRSHLEEDGALYRFDHLTWILCPERLDDLEFLGQLRALITARKHYRDMSMGRGSGGNGENHDDEDSGDNINGYREEETIRFTIRVYAPLFEVRGLIRVWNMLVESAWLSEEEHGRWMQSCLEHEQSVRDCIESKSCSHPGSNVKDESPDYGTRETKVERKPLDTLQFSATATPMLNASGRPVPGHGMTQSYTLPLDEHRELSFSSGHFFTTSSVAALSEQGGNSTTLTYSLSIACTM